MEAAKTLIRTAVRSFFATKQILVIDALMIHSVLHIDDLAILLSTQQKDLRRIVAPLKQAHMLATYTRSEAKIGSTRGIPRDYYYIPLHPAIDAIKYRIMKLTNKVRDMYKVDAPRKEWRCPVCKAEYDQLEVLDKVGFEGFECHRCGNTLVQTEQAAEPVGGHEKYAKLMVQLEKFQELIEHVDRQQIPENDFVSAWERKKEVPKERTGQATAGYIALKSEELKMGRRVGPEHTDASALNVNITSGADQEAAEEAVKEQRKAELAKQNQLPVWHTASAIKANPTAAKAEDSMSNDDAFKSEDNEEKKVDLGMQDAMDDYLEEMKKEQAEEARLAAAEDAESDDDDDGFEDVVSMNGTGTPLPGGAATPASSSQPAPIRNGIKREYDSESGMSSDANTPMGGTPAADDSDRASKRVKFEQASSGPAIPPKREDSDEEDEEEDFEDAI